MRILFDTNVLLDVLLVRDQFVREAALLFDAVERKRITGIVAATTVSTLSYFLDKAYDRQQMRKDLGDILLLFEIAAVGRSELDGALASKITDYEDAALHETAIRHGATGIVSRNVRDFARATIPVYMPRDLIAVLGLDPI